jgi:hypothetical protein
MLLCSLHVNVGDRNRACHSPSPLRRVDSLYLVSGSAPVRGRNSVSREYTKVCVANTELPAGRPPPIMTPNSHFRTFWSTRRGQSPTREGSCSAFRRSLHSSRSVARLMPGGERACPVSITSSCRTLHYSARALHCHDEDPSSVNVRKTMQPDEMNCSQRLLSITSLNDHEKIPKGTFHPCGMEG